MFGNRLGFSHPVRGKQRGSRLQIPFSEKCRRDPLSSALLAAVDAAFGQNRKQARQAGMYLCHRYSGEKIREISKRFTVGESAVTEAARLFSKRLEADKELAEKVARVKAMLKI
ncbi:hypothetical protein ANAEL_04015 [Anaerolineales bacterium]|nr:hypothetical protein ANAEL_04015 [Anaerolineales bacterium]